MVPQELNLRRPSTVATIHVLARRNGHMMTSIDRKRLLKLRAQVEDFKTRVAASAPGCTSDPLPIQLIWTSISRGDTQTLAHWIEWSRSHVKVRKWLATIRAAETALRLWTEVEDVHGPRALIDMGAMAELRSDRKDLECVTANAQKLSESRGKNFRKRYVDFIFWIEGSESA